MNGREERGWRSPATVAEIMTFVTRQTAPIIYKSSASSSSSIRMKNYQNNPRGSIVRTMTDMLKYHLYHH